MTVRYIKQCNRCGASHSVIPSDLKYGKGQFCSKECRYASNGDRSRTRTKVPCATCAKILYRTPYRLRRGNQYCSTTCQHMALLKSTALKCEECSTSIQVANRKRKSRRNFCSQQCKGKYYSGVAHPTRTHGMSRTRIYRSWSMMKDRCYNPNNTCYGRYGGRGIGVCQRWRESFEAFYEDMGDRPSGMSLDRIDNDGEYSPANCRWADSLTQRSNTRKPLRTFEINGVTKTVAEWCREYGVSQSLVNNRISNGWHGEAVFTMSPKPGFRPNEFQ